MQPVHCPRVKICCIKSPDEARLAVSAGASALGLVSHMPSGPGVIDEPAITAIAAKVPPPVATFLLTSLTDPEAIVAQHRRCRTSTIQLCDYQAHATYAVLRERLPGIRLVQVVHVLDEADLARAQELAPAVDALLLDSGNPTLAVKKLGGTGCVHNWALSRRIREAVDVPVFLAGGLSAANVAAAVAEVAPFGLDLCSGVRTQDRLDPEKLAAFFAALHRATGPSA
jgi:phosphoribosylanthranilate isomerase